MLVPPPPLFPLKHTCTSFRLIGAIRCRHLLHLTGIAYSARLKYLMLCGSAVIFPHRGDWEYREFWYHMLKNRENVLYTCKDPLFAHSGKSDSRNTSCYRIAIAIPREQGAVSCLEFLWW